MVGKKPPTTNRVKTQRIIAGAAHNVIMEHGKIVEDLGPVKRYQYLDQESSNIVETAKVTEEQPNIVETPKITEEQPKIGLQLVAENDAHIVSPNRTEETRDNTIIKPNNVSQEQKPKSGIHLTPVPLEDLGSMLKQNKYGKQDKQEKQDQTEPVPIAETTKVKIPTPKLGKKPEQEDILSKIPEPDQDRPSPQDLKISETLEPTEKITPIEELKKSNIPIIEPIKKPPQVPKITVPKIQINIPPKSTADKPAKMGNIPNKLGDILTTNTYQKSKETKVVDLSFQKANENNWDQQPAITREKPTKEKIISMSEELEAELLDERKFEQWMKKQKFHENLAKMAKFTEETSEQKIPELSGKIENVYGEVENVHNEVKNVDNRLGTVDDRLGTVDKSIETLCTGIDCVKEDAKKYQTSQEALEKLVQERFKELGEKVQSLERPTFTCENCGEQAIAPLSSYCPNCGAEIQSWSDENGEPVRGWAPYWKRSGRSTSQ